VSMSKKRESNFDNMAMFSFGPPILMMNMRTRNMMSNVKLSKERIKLFILPTTICLHDKKIPIKETFNKSLKFLKLLKNLGFKLEKIDPSKLTIVINKTHVILVSA
jgi:hypothetical protein